MQDPQTKHEFYMKRCLQLAGNGKGLVSPNPMVGSVIVHKDKIIGEGWHQKAGQAHAEVNAINAVMNKSLLAESTIYVNLEPCSHHGRTPPCADLIIEHKIKKVVIGSVDSNVMVGGRGIERLKEHGVEVVTPVLEDQCRDLNARFYCFHEKKRPYIILKWAQSADAFLAPDKKERDSGSPFWISNMYARQKVHQYRAEEAAILVGKHTALEDNPKLDLRHFEGNPIIRLLIDRNLELPSTAHLMNNSVPTFIYNEEKNDTNGNTSYVKLDFGKTVVEQVLDHLYRMEVQSVIIEGGAFTLSTFIASGNWDKALVFEGNSTLNHGLKAPVLEEKPISKTFLCDTALLTYKNTR
ncbi:bifunctional diaminohydroxyphosphoribosylaminopyrimidine deaminase/5-amino-6-(5-phosphoribosylamino)uracil reductase RibD [Lutimonas sp.]|uniref:bifunctional diaminohydroxyphosphoribosylaminopyrimidine deaminase/5-amino-6-(5-phosphoribosylamino)uracil reductase RibD n=1 Tax=Lutimonas sp. TaxID=1872403 RepID=UPI003D9B41B1